MSTPRHTSQARHRVRLLLGLSLVLITRTLLASPALGAAPTVSLLDRARLSTWETPTGRKPPANVHGYQESDVLYANGQYYLFATGSQDPAWVDVYVGHTPDELALSAPAFTAVAPIRYPTVVKDGDTWHMWGVNPPHRWTEHWVSHEADPVNFVYADSPFLNESALPVVDFAVRHNPADGYWYGVGFETEDNAPLLLTRASTANGPWKKLNYLPNSLGGGIFGDTGAPPWASAARPDPNLAFTADGRAWVFFTGLPATLQPATLLHRAGIVEVNVTTGKAIGNAVVLFNALAQSSGTPLDLASDLVLVAAPGLPDRIFGYTHDPAFPLAVMTLPAMITPTDGRRSTDLVHLDMASGVDVATAMPPVALRPPYRWSTAGLIVPVQDGGVGGYLAGAYLADLNFSVTFKPRQINQGARNTVAFISGPAGCCPSPGSKDAQTINSQSAALSVQIEATAAVPTVAATLRGNDGITITLTSRIPVTVNHEYRVLVRRIGAQVTLEVNGQFQAQATYGVPLTNLESWSLAGEATLTQPDRNPFQGVIPAFEVRAAP